MYKKEQPIIPINRANTASTILIPVRSKMRNRKTSLAVIKIATHKEILKCYLNILICQFHFLGSIRFRISYRLSIKNYPALYQKINDTKVQFFQ